MLLSKKFVSDYIDLDENLSITDIAESMTSVGNEYDYAPNEELFKQYGVPSRFDIKETVFIKKILQTVLCWQASGNQALLGAL